MIELEIGQKRRLNTDNECAEDNLDNEKQMTKLQDETTHAGTTNTPTTKNNEKPNSMGSKVVSPNKINEEFNQIKLNWAHSPSESMVNKFFNSDNKYKSNEKTTLLEKLELRSERKIKRKLNEEKCKEISEKENEHDVVESKEPSNQKSAKNDKLFTNSDALAIKAHSTEMLDQGNKVYKHLVDLSQHVD